MGKPHVNYALEPKPMGIGGQAEVFRARDKRTNQLVAFKRLLPNLRMDQDAIARMRREIDVQSVIKHPNIMPILDYSEHYYWYTMPLAEKSLMDMPTPIEYLQILQIIEEIASGLEFAHQLGNIHRDITPRNILELKSADDKTRWVISDWGLVRRIGLTSVVRTSPGYQYGTEGFAAPESGLDAHMVDARADVYSLGRVVAWCVSGNWPLQNIPLCPEGPLQDLILKTTKLYPHERIANMNEVLQMIDGLKNTSIEKAC
jgi:serine/threonine protein kinase